MARSGHTVYATMRNPQRAPQLGQLAERDNLPITILPMDVDSDESVSTAVSEVLAQAGHIDALVNNAGIGPLGPVEEAPFADFQAIMKTNYRGIALHPGCFAGDARTAGGVYYHDFVGSG